MTTRVLRISTEYNAQEISVVTNDSTVKVADFVKADRSRPGYVVRHRITDGAEEIIGQVVTIPTVDTIQYKELFLELLDIMIENDRLKYSLLAGDTLAAFLRGFSHELGDD